MKLRQLIAPAIASLAMGGLAFAGEPDTTTTTETAPKKNSKRRPPKSDNTGTNKRDRETSEPTADQSKNNKTDLDLTAQIRRAITKESSLSLYAHNVKIIAQNGVVTLKGPVRSESEKQIVETKAAEVAGSTMVKSQIEVTP